MPVDTNDVNTEYEDFWYTGWYNLQVVENIFSDGEFTQELGMFSIPISDQTQEIEDVEEEEPTLHRQAINAAVSGFEVAESGVEALLGVIDATSRTFGQKGIFDGLTRTQTDQLKAIRENSKDTTNEFNAE